MGTILRLTDGSTTVNFVYNKNSNPGYLIPRDAWAPVISRLRRSTLGGRSPYEDVIEEISVMVLGATGAQLLTNLATLTSLVDQAVQWTQGDRISPVKLEFQANGSLLLNPTSALILGRADGDETSGVSLKIGFNDDLKCFATTIRLRLWRRGQWLGATDSSIISSSANISNVQSTTFPLTATVLSPTTLSLLITGFSNSTTTTMNGTLLYAASTSELIVVEAETLAASKFVLTADATTKARGSQYLRYTPTTTAGDTSSPVDLLGLISTTKLIGVYALVRNNSASVSYQVRANATLGSLMGTGTPPTVNGQYTTVDGTSTSPQVVNLGTLASPGGFARLSLTVIASATGSSLDIDYLVIVALDAKTSGVINLQNVVFSMGASNSSATLAISDRSLTDLTPAVTLAVGTTTNYVTYTDDVYILTKGQTLVAMLMAPAGANFRMANSSGTIVSTQLSATRRIAYLTPGQ